MARRRQPDTPPDPKNDPAWLKLRRLIDAKANGRTDAEIAEAAGMDPRVISRLTLKGGPSMKLETLQRILKALPATLSEFDRA